MLNYTGCSDKDEEIKKELEEAEIGIIKLPESYRNQDEVKTIINGYLHGWSFMRARYPTKLCATTT